MLELRTAPKEFYPEISHYDQNISDWDLGAKSLN
jgi:hypothetical protein